MGQFISNLNSRVCSTDHNHSLPTKAIGISIFSAVQTAPEKALKPLNIGNERLIESSRADDQRLGAKVFPIVRLKLKQPALSAYMLYAGVLTNWQFECLCIVFQIAHDLITKRVMIRFRREAHAR
ncbi:hypothetical protein D3C78_1598500 [compost metagenome]